jgi:hypothetical protein
MTKETQGCADEGLGELYRQTAIYTFQRPKVWSVFWMTEIHTVLDCLDIVVFSLLKCVPFILPAI